MSRYGAGLNATLQGASVPYGYTLTVWCSGQVVSDFRGSPRLALIVLFVGGAAAAFALLRWAVRDAHPGTGRQGSRPVSAIALQIGAIAVALGAVALVAQIHSDVDWPVAGFLATAVYMTGTAAGLTLGGS